MNPVRARCYLSTGNSSVVFASSVFSGVDIHTNAFPAWKQNFLRLPAHCFRDLRQGAGKNAPAGFRDLAVLELSVGFGAQLNNIL
jgi:hypothetical protein